MRPAFLVLLWVLAFSVLTVVNVALGLTVAVLGAVGLIVMVARQPKQDTTNRPRVYGVVFLFVGGLVALFFPLSRVAFSL